MYAQLCIKHASTGECYEQAGKQVRCEHWLITRLIASASFYKSLLVTTRFPRANKSPTWNTRQRAESFFRYGLIIVCTVTDKKILVKLAVGLNRSVRLRAKGPEVIWQYMLLRPFVPGFQCKFWLGFQSQISPSHAVLRPLSNTSHSIQRV